MSKPVVLANTVIADSLNVTISSLDLKDSDIIIIQYDPDNFNVMDDFEWLKDLGNQLLTTTGRMVPMFVFPKDGLEIKTSTVQEFKRVIEEMEKMQ